jgi:hypothetical protein
MRVCPDFTRGGWKYEGVSVNATRSVGTKLESPMKMDAQDKSKYNKVQSAGYKNLNIIFMLSWIREKRREKRIRDSRSTCS